MPQASHVICREGKLDDLLGQLGAHRLDIVLADEPASSSTAIRTFNHPLGDSPTAFCASGKLARVLKKGFPKSLHQAPALLPSENTSLRRALEAWFREVDVHPRVIAEFEDLALMQVAAADGRGFIVLPAVVTDEASRRYNFRVVGVSDRCRVQFHAITAERRIIHPAVALMTDTARRQFVGSSRS